ncbi:hypothetical protein Nepgr_018697 [Nepenthes gracilis]|uniref:Uncharacterized protein n=1 Tax=Nepenthes gracilis TaxID=150966 RepID=A0AAD3SU24_NEPGR|nr:hypothetical protein Nepgr_018697 [Nepenthes gracilis]
MGRPPCCDKVGVKKGPWTPEEDIILVSYVLEHGPGNWRAVPTNTGLLRCSKSCRLRWTNYLRPGIKRGNFTEQEEKMIIHLQALLGNRWAAIASYLPDRTDNDIKNYWNTHLRKKLRKLQAGVENENSKDEFSSAAASLSNSKGQWERRLHTDVQMAKQALCEAISIDKPISSTAATTTATCSSVTTAYASSAENIERLLENWMRKTPKKSGETKSWESIKNSSLSNNGGATFDSFVRINPSSASDNSASVNDNTNKANFGTPETNNLSQDENNRCLKSDQVPLSLLEKWLFDENGGQDQESLLDIAIYEELQF